MTVFSTKEIRGEIFDLFEEVAVKTMGYDDKERRSKYIMSNEIYRMSDEKLQAVKTELGTWPMKKRGNVERLTDVIQKKVSGRYNVKKEEVDMPFDWLCGIVDKSLAERAALKEDPSFGILNEALDFIAARVKKVAKHDNKDTFMITKIEMKNAVEKLPEEKVLAYYEEIRRWKKEFSVWHVPGFMELADRKMEVGKHGLLVGKCIAEFKKAVDGKARKIFLSGRKRSETDVKPIFAEPIKVCSAQAVKDPETLMIEKAVHRTITKGNSRKRRESIEKLVNYQNASEDNKRKLFEKMDCFKRVPTNLMDKDHRDKEAIVKAIEKIQEKLAKSIA